MIQNPLSRTDRILRPIAQLHGQTRLVTAALLIPVFAAVFWFSIPRGTWPRVFVALLVVSAVYAAASFLLSRVSIRLAHDCVSERGFFTSNRVASKRIESVLIITAYRGQSLETVPQLFLLDTNGDALLRMRGQFWSTDSIEAMAAAFDVPVKRIEEPLTRAELRRDYSPILYWFEHWPWLGVAVSAGTIAALSLLLILLMSPENLVVR
ncbi:hypothetical protein SAMN06295879_1621 [Agreia bicolorata]|uniref:PH domain-containing protein n=1 Tax=Agreia bicolorata TaxID=110935 RepID=A0A1T4XU73_9MICO|nr:hypothetical protein [Agreia bicolorata]SKA93112.1 hypothetical protein SAMN06295879_1621 [Agreia bicolorata]